MEAPDSGRRLKATLGAPSFARVLGMLRRRVEFGKPLTGRLNLSQASEGERSLLEGLLGRKPTKGDSISFELEELEARLRDAGIASDLRAAVEALGGPLVDRRAAAESVERRVGDGVAEGAQGMAGASRPSELARSSAGNRPNEAAFGRQPGGRGPFLPMSRSCSPLCRCEVSLWLVLPLVF